MNLCVPLSCLPNATSVIKVQNQQQQKKGSTNKTLHLNLSLEKHIFL